MKRREENFGEIEKVKCDKEVGGKREREKQGFNAWIKKKSRKRKKIERTLREKEKDWKEWE